MDKDEKITVTLPYVLIQRSLDFNRMEELKDLYCIPNKRLSYYLFYRLWDYYPHRLLKFNEKDVKLEKSQK